MISSTGKVRLTKHNIPMDNYAISKSPILIGSLTRVYDMRFVAQAVHLMRMRDAGSTCGGMLRSGHGLRCLHLTPKYLDFL